MRMWLVVLGGLLAGLALVSAGCGSDDGEGGEPEASPTATASPTTTASPTATATTPPTSTAGADGGPAIEVGAIRLTNVRYDPPSGAIGPREAIRITADVESSFEGELRVFIAPLSPSEGALRGTTSDGNQAFGRGRGAYDRAMTPVDVREGCPLPDEPVPITGFEVSVFPLDDESAAVRGELPAEFVVDPALVALVDIAGDRYRVVAACQVSPTVGLVSENLLLEAASPLNPHPLVSFQWVLDEGGVSGYVVQRGPGGEVLEGEPGADLDQSHAGGVVTDEAVLFSEGDPATPIPLRRAHARPSQAACPQLTQQFDAEAEESFGGRWSYGLWQACAVEDGLELWLSDGALLSVREAGGGLEASMGTFDGAELTLAADGESSFAGAGGVLRGDLRMTSSAGGPTQRVRFEVAQGDAPCRSPGAGS